MIANFDIDLFPLQPVRITVPPQAPLLVQKQFPLGSFPDPDLLRTYIDSISQLKLPNLLPIRYIREEEGCLHLFYPPIERTVGDLLMERGAGVIKGLHRQLIEFAVGLAKSGILTDFNRQHCGIILQQEQTILQYYLSPLHIRLTHDRQDIETAVSLFASQALRYMRTALLQLNMRSLTSCSSEEWLPDQPETNPSSRLTLDNQVKDNRLLVNMFLPREKQSSKKEISLRKLSVLSKELSEISARHQAKMTPGLSLGKKYSMESTWYGDQTARASDHSGVSRSETPQKEPVIHNLESQIRSKRAQTQLASIQDRMRPYKQALSILKRLRTSP